MIKGAHFIAVPRARGVAAAFETGGLELPPLPLQCATTLGRRVFGLGRATFRQLARRADADQGDGRGATLARVVHAAQRAAKARCNK